MDKKTYLCVTSYIFAAIALLHLMRFLSGWTVVFNGSELPQGLSVVGFMVAGFLAYSGYKNCK